MSNIINALPNRLAFLLQGPLPTNNKRQPINFFSLLPPELITEILVYAGDPSNFRVSKKFKKLNEEAIQHLWNHLGRQLGCGQSYDAPITSSLKKFEFLFMKMKLDAKNPPLPSQVSRYGLQVFQLLEERIFALQEERSEMTSLFNNLNLPANLFINPRLILITFFVACAYLYFTVPVTRMR